jgi:hypothetical protein
LDIYALFALVNKARQLAFAHGHDMRAIAISLQKSRLSVYAAGTFPAKMRQ